MVKIKRGDRISLRHLPQYKGTVIRLNYLNKHREFCIVMWDHEEVERQIVGYFLQRIKKIDGNKKL